MPEPATGPREATPPELACQRARYEALLAALYPWLPWRIVTARLPAAQRDLLADSIDEQRERASEAEPGRGMVPVDRWWLDLPGQPLANQPLAKENTDG